jgi:hypothetical protein
MKKLAGLMFFAMVIQGQQVDWSQIKNKPFLTASDYRFTRTNGIGATGDLSASGANTVTLTPCPKGINGTDANHYVYISGGTGTAEAVLVTGGSCTSGASTGTLTFTTSNTHSGQWAISSAAGGIPEALSDLPAAGGSILLPAGATTVYATISIGNGSAAGASTRKNVGLIGQGAGGTSSEILNPGGATSLNWAGADSGTMLQILGPIAGVRLSDMYFSCGSQTHHADRALYAIHPFSSAFTNLTIDSCGSYSIDLTAYDNPSGVVIGANNNVWENISIYSNGVATSSGIRIGAADTGNPYGFILDVAKNHFKHFAIGAGSSGVGVNLRFTDNGMFTGLNITSGAIGILVSQATTIHGSHFPAAYVCYMCNISATTLLDDSSWTGATLGMFFLPYNPDSELLPNPVGTNSWSAGMSINMKPWGIWKWNNTLYNAVTSSSAIANTASETAFSKSYQIPALYTDQVGLIVRIRAGGKYSTTGTPTLTLTIRVGGTGVDGYPVAGTYVTTANNASDYGWSAQADFVVRATGISGTAQRGPSFFGVGGVSAPTSAYSGTFEWATLVPRNVHVTAQWGTASASNTITMDTLQVELINPGVSN